MNAKTMNLLTALFLAMLVATSVSAGEPTPSKAILIDIRLVQIDEPIKEMSLRGTQMILRHPSHADKPAVTDKPAAEPQESRSHDEPQDPDGRTIRIRQPSKTPSMDVTMITITDDALIKIGDSELHLTDGKFFERINGTDRNWRESTALSVIAAPRVLVNTGEKANITMGSRVPFMVQREDGCLVIEEIEDLVEGFSVDVQAEEKHGNVVLLKKLDIKFSTVVDRLEIPGVPFDVGRPVIRSMETSSALSLAPKQMAIISLPRTNEDTPPIFVFLTARLVAED